MNRRQFLRTSLAAGAAAGLAGSAGSGCAVAPVRPDGSPETEPVERLLAAGARAMWCAPHPDDECFVGSLLARASVYYGNPTHLVVLTHGEGGECCRPEGCRPSLATIRGQEMRQVAERYRATLQLHRFWNAPLPVESFPPRQVIYDERWRKQGDPVDVVTRAIRRFRPDVLFTFHPDWGATGHPEHQLGSRVATAAVRRAADSAAALPGLPPHRVTRTYYLLNRFWLMRLVGRADPGPTTEVWDARQPCRPGMDCRDFMLEATRFHRTQDRDMGTVRRFHTLFAELILRQVDSFTEIHEPDEPVPA